MYKYQWGASSTSPEPTFPWLGCRNGRSRVCDADSFVGKLVGYLSRCLLFTCHSKTIDEIDIDGVAEGPRL